MKRKEDAQQENTDKTFSFIEKNAVNEFAKRLENLAGLDSQVSVRQIKLVYEQMFGEKL